MRAGIEPGEAAAQHLHRQQPILQIHLVQRSDLQFAARGRFNLLRHRANLLIIKIEAGHRIIRFRLRRLLFQRDRLELFIELHHAEALRVHHLIAENRGAAVARADVFQLFGEALTKENVIAQHQRAAFAGKKVLADDKRLRQAFRLWLHGELQLNAERTAVTQQPLKGRQIFRRGDHQNLSNARQHQHGERIVNHRLVIHRQQLFGYAAGDRMQPGARAAGEYDTFHTESRCSSK